MAKRLYVGNLNYSTTDSTLRELFGEYGTVTDVTVIEGKGFAFVEYDSDESAQEAINNLNETEVDGRDLRVDVAHERPQRSGGGGGGRGGGGGGGGYNDRW
jgi:RNA recognition motif-containing protein